jgi:hypothetical protein
MEQSLGDIKIGRVNSPMIGYISIRCDRKTPLGNPFYMSNESQRIEVCNKFEAYLPEAYATDHVIRSEVTNIAMHVESGHNVLLQCWCAPKKCHCDSIKSFVLNLINKMPE